MVIVAGKGVMGEGRRAGGLLSQIHGDRPPANKTKWNDDQRTHVRVFGSSY